MVSGGAAARGRAAARAIARTEVRSREVSRLRRQPWSGPHAARASEQLARKLQPLRSRGGDLRRRALVGRSLRRVEAVVVALDSRLRAARNGAVGAEDCRCRRGQGSPAALDALARLAHSAGRLGGGGWGLGGGPAAIAR